MSLQRRNQLRQCLEGGCRKTLLGVVSPGDVTGDWSRLGLQFGQTPSTGLRYPSEEEGAVWGEASNWDYSLGWSFKLGLQFGVELQTGTTVWGEASNWDYSLGWGFKLGLQFGVGLQTGTTVWGYR